MASKKKLMNFINASTAKEQCEICKESYNFLFNRENICKRCGRSVCKNCRKYARTIIRSLSKPAKEDKVCTICKNESDQLKSFSFSQKCSWNQHSKFEQEMMKKLNLSSTAQLKDEYNEMKNQWKVAVQEKDRWGQEILTNIKQDLIMCYFNDDYLNYTYMEWIYFNQRLVKREEVFDVLIKLVGTFLISNPHVGYSTDIFLIALFLLTVCRDYTAYQLLSKLYLEITPDILLPYSQQQPNFIQLLHEGLIIQYLGEFQAEFKVESSDLPVVKKFMEYYLVSYISSFFINVLSFSTFFGIFQELIDQNNFNVITQYFYIVIKLVLKFTKQIGVSNPELKQYVLRNTNIGVMKDLKKKLDDKEPKLPLAIKTPRENKQILFPSMNQPQSQSTYDEFPSPIKIQTANESIDESVNESITKKSQYDDDNEELFVHQLINEQVNQIAALKGQLQSKTLMLEQLKQQQQDLKKNYEQLQTSQTKQKQDCMKQFEIIETKHSILADHFEQALESVIKEIA